MGWLLFWLVDRFGHPPTYLPDFFQVASNGVKSSDHGSKGVDFVVLQGYFLEDLIVDIALQDVKHEGVVIIGIGL